LEKLGRGWSNHLNPVPLEPPFSPFFFHDQTGAPAPVIDDGRSETFLSGLFGKWTKKKPEDSTPTIDLVFVGRKPLL